MVSGEDWKTTDVNVESLWLIDKRDNSGKHENNYHGNFVPQIPYQLIKRYTSEGDTVLELFAGSGTTLYECEKLNRNYIGFDINDKMIAHIYQKMIDTTNIDFIVNNCDVCNTEKMQAMIVQFLQKEKKSNVDFIIAHPPYMDIVKFTEKSEDLSNITDLNIFIEKFTLAMKNALAYLEKNKYFAVVIGDVIQERVQRDKRFTRIGLGVYALTAYIDNLPKAETPKNEKAKSERKHDIIQGMLLEIGNHQKDISDTYTNDKKWIFENKTLGSLATLQKVPSFTFQHIIDDSVFFADVIWFNERHFPQVIFEVEHSTDFRDAFIKFMELQDFQTRFYCVSDENRRSKFEKEKAKSAFSAINNRIQFLTYEQVENDYERAIKRAFITY